MLKKSENNGADGMCLLPNTHNCGLRMHIPLRVNDPDTHLTHPLSLLRSLRRSNFTCMANYIHDSNCFQRSRDAGYPLFSLHTTESSINHLGRHSTQTQTSEVRCAAGVSGHWVVNNMFAKVTPKRQSHKHLKKTSNGRRRKSTWDKVNVSNSKVNRGCATLTANRTSADCVQISLGPSMTYIPRGVYHTWGFNAMVK